MSLDSKFVIASDLQSIFLDTASGAPMSGGTISFFQDISRSTPKLVYILSGSPPYNDMSYIPIGSTVTLGPAGNVTYMNNDVIIYYFPYDGTPSTTTGTIDLYYVTVVNSNSVPQFTRVAWPNTQSMSGQASQGLKNYIPNGQFVNHNNIAPTSTTVAGQVPASTGLVNIAQGGWTFERDPGSTAVDIITFPRQPSNSETWSADPRYVLQVQTTAIGTGNSYKFIGIKFKNVNMFASGVISFTFAIQSLSPNGPISVGLYLRKNFGSGGSAQTDTLIDTYTLQNSVTYNHTTVTFGVNDAFTLGDDSDYVQLYIALPINAFNNFSFCNAILAPGAVTITDYIFETYADVMARSISGWVDTPDYSGKNLYLEPQLTQYGMTWSNCEVGDIVMESNFKNYTNSISTVCNRLLADGNQYFYNQVSPLGIPFSRLGDYLFNSTVGIPIYGTGRNFMSASYVAAATSILITNNSPGPVTNAANGSPSTGFTLTTISKLPSATYTTGLFSYLTGTATFNVQGLNFGAVNATPSQTGQAGFSGGFVNIQVGSAVLQELDSVLCPAGSAINAGSSGNHYITFWYYASGVGTNAAYVWSKVDGSGSDPAPTIMGSTSTLSIEADVLSTDTAAQVAQKYQQAINGWQQTLITGIVAGGSIVANSFFNINAINTSNATVPYFVWYNLNGAGTQPVAGIGTAIPVIYLGTETATVMAQKTQVAINQFCYATPDARDLFIRGYDNGRGLDPDAATRWSLVPGIIGPTMGTFQLSQNISHNHSVTVYGAANAYSGNNVGPPGMPEAAATTFTGGSESRPINFYANIAIKY